MALEIMFSWKSPFLPNLALAVEWLQRKRYRRMADRADAGKLRQWFLLLGSADKEWLLHPRPEALPKLLPPDDRSWADPFLWRHGERWFIFCEEWLANEPHAHIAVMEVSPAGRVLSPAQSILKKQHHLSYPFLFEYEGVLHMIPEGGHGRSIDLYQCEVFPQRWRKRTTLMGDILFADATLLEHEKKWWLFATIKQGLYALNRDLFVFWADSPLTDRWHAHPANPVVRSLQSARPAGRIFSVGGKLFRPSQNCLVRYGHSLRINEILRLDTRCYQERLVTEVKSDWAENIRANHHVDWHDGLVVMDAQRLVP